MNKNGIDGLIPDNGRRYLTVIYLDVAYVAAAEKETVCEKAF